MTTHPHLSPKLKKEYNYTSSPPRGLVACSRVNFTFTFTFNWRFFTNRGTVKVLAHQTYMCDTHTHTHTLTHTNTHVYIDIEVAAYQKACCRSCINLYLVIRNVTPTSLEHGRVIGFLIRNAAVFISFSYG